MSSGTSRRNKILAGCGCASLLGLVAFCIFFFLVLPPMVERYVVEQARQRGVELKLGEVTLWFGSATIENAEFRLIGVSGISGHLNVAEVGLSGLTPTDVSANGVKLAVEGSAATLALELAEWTKQHPNAFKLPVKARGIDLAWRAKPGEAPWLEFKDGAIARSGAGHGFSASNVKLAGVTLGKVGASYTSAQSAVVMGFGEQDLKKAPIRIDVKHELPRPSAIINVSPVDLKKLTGPLGVDLNLDNVTVSGKATLELEPGLDSGEVDGSFEMKLKGYVPPHPQEISGFVFGDTSTFESKLHISADRKLLTLRDSKFKAGAFVLKGGGTVTRMPDHARIQLSLRGDLPCAELANSAIKSHVPGAVGGFIGGFAKGVLQGSVGVYVAVDADSRKLPEAKVLKTIGIGCGLRPLKLPDLSGFQLPDLKDLPPPPKGVPPLPSGLPPPPAFPIPDFGNPP